MKTINAIVFSILMDHHGMGVEHAHPDYVNEKLKTLELVSESEAVAMLDYHNQCRLKHWLKTWSYPVPAELMEWYNET
jgi:hypothetical protein